MPLTVSPSAPAPAPPASPGGRTTARSADPDSGQAGSFGEVMARSLEAGREKTEEPTIKPAPSKPVRRPADTEDSPVQDSANPMAVLLAAPLENRLDITITAATAAAAAGTPILGDAAAAAAGPTGRSEIPLGTLAAVDLDKLLPAAPAGPGDALALMAGGGARVALAPGPAVGVAAGADPALLPAREIPSSQDVPLAATLGTQAALAPGRAAIASTTADSAPALARESVPLAATLGTQAALASGRAAIASASADSAPALAREIPSSPGVPLATDVSAAAAQADAASAGLSDPSSGPGDDGSQGGTAALDGQAEVPLAAADTQLFSSAGGLVLPAGAALQQSGNAAAPSAPSPVASALLLPDVGSSEWAKALGQQVIHLSAADRQVAELQLNPPGLGPLKVMLSMNDQQMQAAFISAHSSVRAAVESALPQLRALLAESGISLGQTSVGAESQPRAAFSNGQDDSGRPSPRSANPARDAATAALFSASAVAVQHRPGQGLRIDTYA